MIPFDVLKSLPMAEVVVKYGGDLTRTGFCKCPFHDEKTASMKIYPDHAYCFGCGRRVDTIGYVAQILETTQFDAAKRLAIDYNIPTEDTAQERERIQHKLEKIQKEKKDKVYKNRVINRAFSLLCCYIRTMNEWKRDLAPTTRRGKKHPDQRWLWALSNVGYAEYVFDDLMEKDDNQRYETIMKLHSEGFFEKIKRYIPTTTTK